jgi:chromosome segregation ATPase
LERRARERYDTLDHLDAELNWYRGQYDALVEALRTPNRWLEYRAEALRDQLPEQDAQSIKYVSAVERVKTALVDWDEALHKAREDLAGARTVAAAWQAEVASSRAQLQQDRAALEGREPGRVRPRRRPRRLRG